MAGSFYTISLAAAITEIKAALISKYGVYEASINPNGITIYYESTTDLIFMCKAICSKHLRLYASTSSYQIYWGTNWTSGASLVGQSAFSGTYNYGITGIYLILFEDTMILQSDAVDSGRQRFKFCIIGKLSNAHNFIGGMYSTDYGSDHYCMDLDTGIYLFPLGVLDKYLSPANRIYVKPLYLADADNNKIYLDDLSEKVYIKNVKACSWGDRYSYRAVVTNRYMISSTNLCTARSGVIRYVTTMGNGILVEF